MSAFLAGLPALLGILGFVIFLLLKKSVTEDPIIKAIIEKLKYEQPDFAEKWKELNNRQKEGLLKDENALKDKITTHDRELLGRALANQFRTNIFVYLLCSILLLLGIYLFIAPKPLIISDIQIQNTDSTSVDLIVDIDPVIVTWTSSGPDGEVFVVLENIETGKQTKRYRSLASDGKIKFNSDKYSNYDKILSNRNPNESNRIRAVVYSKNGAFSSKDFELKVGVKIICYEEPPNKVIFNAIIDQTIIDNFHFSPRMTLFKDEHFNGSHLFETESYSSQPEMIIDNPKDYTTVNFVFSANPRDVVNSKIYRTDVESLRDAVKALQNGNN